MGELAESDGPRRHLIEAENFIGRSQQCALHLPHHYVSGQHALLRWSGRAWELRDLGSRNGTWLNRARVAVQASSVVSKGDVIAFGNPAETWTMTSAAPPQPMVVNVVTGEQLVAVDNMLGVPSDEAPQATLLKAANGCWCIDLEEDALSVVDNGCVFQVSGQTWRFSCPEAVAATVSAEAQHIPQPVLLHFLVSRDEEYVELRLEFGDRVVHLGNRSQNHLLLTLARARLRDVASGLPVTSCGWVYKEDLVSIAETPQRVDNDVFRIRKHFAQHAVYTAASVIERRTRTRQLRIGLGSLKITTL